MEEYGIENYIGYSVGFDYPLGDRPSERFFDVGATDAVIRLASVVFSSDKPKLTLAALLYATGIDVGIYLGCDNTETAIAKTLGESKQKFSWLVKKLKKDWKLNHTNTGKTSSSRETYKDNNYRKPKYD